MSNHRAVYQQQHNVSIPKKKLVDIASTYNLGKTELRVLLVLFGELNGWVYNEKSPDPKNYSKIDVERIAQTLDLKKGKVSDAITALVETGLIEKGKNDTINKGYRFTF